MKYRSTTNPRLMFYVEPAIPQGWIVVSQVKGYPPTEHTGTIHMKEQDADDEARALAGHPLPRQGPKSSTTEIPSRQDELERLRTFAAAQHPESYLGGWMKILLPYVEQAIKNDLIPDDTPGTLREVVKEQAREEMREEMKRHLKEKMEAQAQAEHARKEMERHRATIAAILRHTEEAARSLSRASNA